MITVTAAIMFKDDQVLIGRRKPGLRHAGKWEFPGGKMESYETPQACLKREMREEFNIQVRVGDPFAENHFFYQRGPIHLMAFRVEWIDGELRATVHDRIAWVSPANLTSYDLLPADIPFAEKLVAQIKNQILNQILNRAPKTRIFSISNLMIIDITYRQPPGHSVYRF